MKRILHRHIQSLALAAFFALAVSICQDFAIAETIQYTYDNADQVTVATYPDGTAFNFIYDTSGNRLSETIASSTHINNPPYSFNNTAPANDPDNPVVSLNTTLSWTASTDGNSGDSVVYDIYIGTSSTPPLIVSGYQTTSYSITLEPLATYYWKVVARDNHNATTEGALWSFRTTDDYDHDGIRDTVDNCPNIANSEQADMDNDGAGDVCDDDKDGDGILNINDNCPLLSNNSQSDLDNDGYGDACDGDDDGDGVADAYDNCSTIYNPDQANIDGDALGDLCDDNMDGDNVPNDTDNCISVNNPKVNNVQADLDGDGIGDMCDTDIDGDSIDNVDDNCQMDANLNQEDSDSDGYGDVCTIFNYCVSDAGTLQSILETAKTNNKNDIIKLVQGTYSVKDNNNLRFNYASPQFYSLVIKGGYVSGCNPDERVLDPANTVLDGMINDVTLERCSKVMEVSDSFSTGYPDWLGLNKTAIEIEGVTIQNGQVGLSVSSQRNATVTNSVFRNNITINDGRGIFVSITDGTIIFRNNVVKDNKSDYKTGAHLQAFGGSIIAANNLIFNNEATTSNGGGGLYISALLDNSSARIINNTITGNKATYSLGKGGGLYLNMSAASSKADIYNNIILGNTANSGSDMYLTGSGKVYAFNNDYDFDEVFGSFVNTASLYNWNNIDPRFEGEASGNYRLDPTATLINSGYNFAPSLPETDIEGNPRIYDGIVDMGAYEFMPDADGDGVGDLYDNCRFVSNPDQVDDNYPNDDNSSLVGDQHYGDVCDPDFDDDGLVSLSDYSIWRQYYRQTVPPAPAYVDLDSDNLIGLSDYAVWRAYYRSVPGPGIGD